MKGYVIKGCSDLKVIDAKLSEKCKKYHENSSIQINMNNKTYIRKIKDLKNG